MLQRHKLFSIPVRCIYDTSVQIVPETVTLVLETYFRDIGLTVDSRSCRARPALVCTDTIGCYNFARRFMV